MVSVCACVWGVGRLQCTHGVDKGGLHGYACSVLSAVAPGAFNGMPAAAVSCQLLHTA